MSGSTAGPAGFMDFTLLRGNSRRRDLLEIGLLLFVSLESLTFNWTAAFCSDISMSNVSCSGLYDDPLTSQGDGDFKRTSLSLALFFCVCVGQKLFLFSPHVRVHCESQVGLEGTEERNTL